MSLLKLFRKKIVKKILKCSVYPQSVKKFKCVLEVKNVHWRWTIEIGFTLKYSQTSIWV